MELRYPISILLGSDERDKDRVKYFDKLATSNKEGKTGALRELIDRAMIIEQNERKD